MAREDYLNGDGGGAQSKLIVFRLAMAKRRAGDVINNVKSFLIVFLLGEGSLSVEDTIP